MIEDGKLAVFLARGEESLSVSPGQRLGDYRVDEKTRRVNGTQYDLLLVLYGWAPNIEYAVSLGIAMDTQGHVVTDPKTGEATVRGVFAAGELAGRMHPCCVTAMADGVVVAKAIQQQLARALITRMVAILHRLAGEDVQLHALVGSAQVREQHPRLHAIPRRRVLVQSQHEVSLTVLIGACNSENAAFAAQLPEDG
jgi:NADH dehydrogenase FAD-containing subunit